MWHNLGLHDALRLDAHNYTNQIQGNSNNSYLHQSTNILTLDLI